MLLDIYRMCKFITATSGKTLSTSWMLADGFRVRSLEQEAAGCEALSSMVAKR